MHKIIYSKYLHDNPMHFYQTHMKELEKLRKSAELVLDLTKDTKLSVNLQKLNNDIRRLLVRSDVQVIVLKK